MRQAVSGLDAERITRIVHESLSPLLTDTLGVEHGWDAAEGVASAIITSGECSPRKLNYLAELDALPDGAVVHDGGGWGAYSVWIKDASMGWGDTIWWQGGSGVPRPSTDITLPVVAIYEPNDEGVKPI